jgi:hypothetical protein
MESFKYGHMPAYLAPAELPGAAAWVLLLLGLQLLQSLLPLPLVAAAGSS